MSKKVVTDVDYSYATFSGNVSSISVKSDYVPDSSDYNKLKNKITSLEEKVEILENHVSNLKEFVSTFSREIEDITHHSMQDILKILAENEKHIANLTKS